MQRCLIILSGFLCSGSSIAVLPQSPPRAAPSQQSDTTARQGVVGNWEGVLSVGQQKLRLVLKISRSADGLLQATVDSLDQGATDLTIDTITSTDGVLHFEMKDLSAVYDGTFTSDGAEVTGTWKQGGNSL